MGFINPTFILAFVGIIHHSLGFVQLDTTPQPLERPSRAVLHNVSLQTLSSGYLKRLYSDLTLLRIHSSSIEKIDKYAFDYLNHLNLLEISDSEINQEIDPDTFSRLSGLEILILNNIRMSKAKFNLTHVQELILAKNDLEVLDGEYIVGKDVNYIDVSGNKLRELNGSFANLSKLSMIDISKNRLSEIGHVFDKNANLLRILASENKIVSMKGLQLPWLKSLDLFSNNLVILDSGSFPKMAALEELVLAFNNIRHIDDAFRDLLELKFLNLAWNRIEDLPPHLFRNNLYLTRLSLQGNKIKSLEKFQSVHHHLTHLDLSHNEFALISDEFFTSVPSLQVLDLSFNRLKTLTDSLAPLSHLQELYLSYNELVFSGYELLENQELQRANLSFNELQNGVSLFRNHKKLRDLDVSGNDIVDFCDEEVALKNLVRLSLRGNKIQRLNCLPKMKALCEVDIRHNPMTCGEKLDAMILTLAEGKCSPYSPHKKMATELEEHAPEKCENLPLNQSLILWNSIKRELCPEGKDLKAEASEWGTSSEEEARGTESSEAESLESKEIDVHNTSSATDDQKKQFLVVPIGWIDQGGINKPNPLENPQSERASWEKLEENAELVKDLEEEERGRRSRFSWYTVALILIGLSLTLTCFNLVVFFYIKMRVWKRSDTTSVKFTYLPNEVYKNTIEPSKVVSPEDGEWFLENQTQNKIFSFGKINEFLLNFRLQKKDRDTESAKNLILNPSTNNGALHC